MGAGASRSGKKNKNISTASTGTETKIVTESITKETEARQERKRVNEETVTNMETNNVTKQAVDATFIICDCGKTCVVLPTKAPVMKLQCFGIDSFQIVSNLVALTQCCG